MGNECPAAVNVESSILFEVSLPINLVGFFILGFSGTFPITRPPFLFVIKDS